MLRTRLVRINRLKLKSVDSLRGYEFESTYIQILFKRILDLVVANLN